MKILIFHIGSLGDTLVSVPTLHVIREYSCRANETRISAIFSPRRLVQTNRNDTLNNIAISIPFEFVGNYGWCAGILSFGLIGVFWSLLCGWMLSPARLSNHPLTPFLALSTMGMEGALGHYLAGLRGLIIPLVLCFFVYRMLRRRI